MFFLFEDMPLLRTTIAIVTTPDTDVAKQKVSEELMENINSDDGKSFGKYLSDKVDMDLQMEQINLGSIHIDWRVAELSELENIKSLSDTGVLSNIVTYFLIKRPLLAKCDVKRVFLKTVVTEESYEALLKFAEGKYSV